MTGCQFNSPSMVVMVMWPKEITELLFSKTYWWKLVPFLAQSLWWHNSKTSILTTKSREVSTPQDCVLAFLLHSQIWQALWNLCYLGTCQISQLSNHIKLVFCCFKTLWDFTRFCSKMSYPLLNGGLEFGKSCFNIFSPTLFLFVKLTLTPKHLIHFSLTKTWP